MGARSVAIAAFLVVIFSGAGYAAEKVSRFQLANGLDMVVIEDHRAPAVTHMAWYRIGAADEPAGKSGIAHFVEHLMFKGTEKFGPEEFSRIVQSVGGTSNAFTSYDYTAYIQRVAADRLETVMEMEADRMRGLILSDEDIEVDRQVVLEERIERTDSDPDAQFREQRQAAMYLNHPYGIPIIGWRHEIELLSRDDIFDFYRQYYAPNNAILVVAGDVLPEDAFALAKKHYGPIEPSPNILERKRPEEPPHLVERRLSFSDPRVAQPYVIRSYLAPERDPGDQETAAALAVLAQILGGGGITSFLSRELEIEKEVALYATAFYRGLSVDDTTFGVYALPKEGISLQKIEDALDLAISKFLETGVDDEHLDRVKAQARSEWIYEQDDVKGLAFKYGEALTAGLDIQDIEDWPNLIESVSKDDVMEAARNIFDRSKSVTGWVMNEESEI